MPDRCISSWDTHSIVHQLETLNVEVQLGPTTREFPMFPAYHQSYDSGITRPLYNKNKKEGGIDLDGTDEQVLRLHIELALEELLNDQEHPDRDR